VSWMKSSDTAGAHPVVLVPLAWPAPQDGDVYREDLVNLLFGMVTRCALHSAGYDTDYVISDGTVSFVAGPGWEARAVQAERAGYWSRVESGWLLMDDSEHFVHIRLAAEKEWERIRKLDNGNPALTIPVRLRDGDGCRYCGCIVNWKARRGGRNGTYDHVYPGKAARGPDDLRVACGSCNAARGANPDALTVLPAPAAPFFGEVTVGLLAEHGITVPLSTPPRPRHKAAAVTTATGDPAPSGTPPEDPARPASPADNAPAAPKRRTATRQPAGHRAEHHRDRAASPTPPPVPGDPATSRTTPAPTGRPATRQPAGHRALSTTTPATRQPGGHRAQPHRDRAASPTPPAHNQDQQRSRDGGPTGNGGNRQIASLPDLTGSGRDRDRDGSGGPALSPPPTDRNRRRRGRRGRAHRPTQEDP
jgi:hypothetical protein